MAKNYDVKDIRLAQAGRKRILWAAQDMPVLQRESSLTGKRRGLDAHGL